MQVRERTVTLLALAVLSAAFLAFAAAYSGRAVNNAWGDIDLGGWSAFLGHRLLTGERLYRELFVALPPGALSVLALIERASGGGPRLLHEIWVCGWSRELAHDCLAQVAACAVVAGFLYAATDLDERRARRRFAAAGGLAAVAMLFEQHTGFGALAALVVGAGCLATFERHER